MGSRDDAPQYDLAETGRRLRVGPAMLARRARLRLVPAVREGGRWRFPTAWVDAAGGERPVDPAYTAAKWLERLAPPPPEAWRTTRPRSELPLEVEDLLRTEPVLLALRVDKKALRRLEGTGQLPGLDVDGTRVYDRTLVDLLADAASGEAEVSSDSEAHIESRRALVEGWSRFAWRTAAAPQARQPVFDPESSASPAVAGNASDATSAPKAFAIPDTLGLTQIKPLVEADGFAAFEED